MGTTMTWGVLATTTILAFGPAPASAQLTYTPEERAYCAAEFRTVEVVRDAQARRPGTLPAQTEERNLQAIQGCLARYQAEVAARQTRREARAREQRVRDAIPAALADPESVQVATSAVVCRAQDARQEAQEALGEEARKTRVSGVVAVRRRRQLADKLHDAEEVLGEKLAGAKQRGIALLPCDDDRVAAVYDCAADPTATSCRDEHVDVLARLAGGRF